jgi:hypothetical protein
MLAARAFYYRTCITPLASIILLTYLSFFVSSTILYFPLLLCTIFTLVIAINGDNSPVSYGLFKTLTHLWNYLYKVFWYHKCFYRGTIFLNKECGDLCQTCKGPPLHNYSLQKLKGSSFHCHQFLLFYYFFDK